MVIQDPKLQGSNLNTSLLGISQSLPIRGQCFKNFSDTAFDQENKIHLIGNKCGYFPVAIPSKSSKLRKNPLKASISMVLFLESRALEESALFLKVNSELLLSSSRRL